MTPADRRIAELIDKWLTSIDLHLGYAELSDAAYARVQSWPKHDRPTRWVLEVAHQKIVELKTQCEKRQAMGDATFAEALELMAFLANLVGIQHIHRFIPMAAPARHDKTGSTATVEAPTLIRPASGRTGSPHDEATREMPQLKPAAASPPAGAAVARKEPAKPAVVAKRGVSPSVKPEAKPETKPETVSPSVTADMRAKIATDAARLLKWGKPWHELAELIGRIADRPPVAEIRKVLRAQKAEIEAKSAKNT